MSLFSRPLDRRLDHLERVINARSEEQIAAIAQLSEQVQAIADSHRDLAENITQVIESHLAFHVESMTAIGAMLAEVRATDGADHRPESSGPAGGAAPGA